MNYILPLFFALVLIFGAIKKVNLYDSFLDGIKSAMQLFIQTLPYVIAVILMSELFSLSGLNSVLIDLLTPFFRILGIPPELFELILLKPLSGSGAVSKLNQIIETYGADSFISRSACVIFSSGETVFYISAVYLSNCKNKKVLKAIVISLISNFLACVMACLTCKIM